MEWKGRKEGGKDRVWKEIILSRKAEGKKEEGEKKEGREEEGEKRSNGKEEERGQVRK